MGLRANDFATVIKRANDNGSALVTVLSKLLIPARNRLHMNRIMVSGQTSGGTLTELQRKINCIFRFPRDRLFTRAILGSIVFNPLGLNISPTRTGRRTLATLRTLGLPDSLGRQSPFRLSNKRVQQITVTNILTVRPDILVLSRPATKLSPRTDASLLSLISRLRRGNAAVLVVARRVRRTTHFTSRILMVGRKRGTTFVAPRRLFDGTTLLGRTNVVPPTDITFTRRLRDRNLHLTSDVPLAVRGLTSRLTADLGQKKQTGKWYRNGAKHMHAEGLITTSS